jgi:hypothetical protein
MGAWEDGFSAGWDKAMEAASKFGPLFIDPEARRSRSKPSFRDRPRRTASAYSKRLGTALRRIRKKAIKKDGDFRKGWDNAKIMRLAHKEARKK